MKKRILIVDDELAFNHMMKLTLELTGLYEVRTSYLSSQFQQLAYGFKPNLILLDCMMPGMDGGEVAARLQKDPGLRDIPFAFLTATVSTIEVASSGCYEGPVTYLPKTIRLEDLVDYIERTTQSSQARQEALATVPSEAVQELSGS